MLASLVNQKKNRHFPCIYGVVELASLLKQKKIRHSLGRCGREG